MNCADYPKCNFVKLSNFEKMVLFQSLKCWKIGNQRGLRVNIAGPEAAIQREMEKQKQKKKIVRELADHIATETLDWLQMRGLMLGKSE